MKILIGEISSYKAIVIASFLKTTYPDIVVLTYDNKKIFNSLHTKYSDKHFMIVKHDLNNYIQRLSVLCKDEKVELFIPVHSNYIGEIIKNKELFGQCLSYLGNYSSYLQLHDKLNLYTIAQKLNIPTPIHFDSIESASIPFVAKPKDKSAAKGVMYVNSLNDKSQLLKAGHLDYIYQSYIKGKGCGFSVFAENGKVWTGYGHIRLSEYPVSGGSSIYRAGFKDERMKIIAERILEEVCWSGFIMFEFKLTEKNEIILIEANPRIWGSINQGLQNGVNYFEPLIPHKTRANLNQSEVYTYLTPHIYLSFLAYIFKGNLKSLVFFLKNILKNKADVSIADDFKGWLSVLIRSIHI